MKYKDTTIKKGKKIKNRKKLLVRILLALLFLLLLVSILLSTSSVQTRLAKVATNYVNDKFNVSISVSKIDLSSLGRGEFKEVLIKDHHKDTLIYVENLSAEVLSFSSILRGNLQFYKVKLKKPYVQMKTYKDENIDNLTVFIDKLSQNSKEQSDNNFLLNILDVSLQEGTFVLVDDNVNLQMPFQEIQADLNDFQVRGSAVTSKINSLSIRIGELLKIKEMSTNLSYNEEEISLGDLLLKTDKSSIVKGELSFRSNEGSYAHFLDKVPVKSYLKGNLQLEDLHSFYSEFSKVGHLNIDTKISGTLNNLQLHKIFVRASNANNRIKGDFTLKQIFDSDKWSIFAQVQKAVISPIFLKRLLPNVVGKHVSKNLEEMGSFTTSGSTKISGNTIVTNSQILNDRLGFAKVDLQMSQFDNVAKAKYDGTVNLKDFNLGEVSKNSKLGNISANLKVKGSGFTRESLKATTSGKVEAFTFNGYTYQNVILNGIIEDKRFDGAAEINDSNVKLNFTGLIDFSKKEYVADFKSVVDYSDLNKLQLFTRDSIANFRGELKLNAKGSSLENVVGQLSFENMSFTNPKDTYFFKDFKLTSTFKDSLRVISVNSPEIISGNIKGKYKVQELGKLAQNAFASIYTSYQPVEVSSNQYCNFNLKIYNKVVEVLFPNIALAANTIIKGSIESDDNNFKLSVKSPQMNIKENRIHKINIQVDNKNPLFNAQISIDSINTKYYDVSRFKLVNVTLNDTLFFTSEFKGGNKAQEKYDLSFYHTLQNGDKSVFGILKSTMEVKGNKWFFNRQNDRKNKITYNHTTNEYSVDSVSISSIDQFINIDGKGTKNSKDLHLDFQNIHLSKIMPSIKGLHVKGTLDGNLIYNQKGNEICPQADMHIAEFEVNDVYQGDANLLISSKESEVYDVNMSLGQKNEQPTVSVTGELDFSKKIAEMDLDIGLLAFDIKPFNFLATDVFNNLRGEAYGDINLKGRITTPKLKGDLYLDKAGLYIPLLNVDYDLAGTSVIELKEQSIDFVDVLVQDVKNKTKGKFTGSITHKNFENWMLNLAINSNNLLVLDTEETEDVLYYGTSYFDGIATIKGSINQLAISVNGKTKKGTYFVVPMSYVKTAENSDIIRFVNEQDKGEYIKNRWKLLSKKLEGISLDFNLELTKDAIFKMILDKDSGSYLEGSGTGNVQIGIDTKDKFDIYGYFIVDKGVYDFKYGLISKPFNVEKGGIIKFNGDPLNAEIDLDAVHKVSANPKTILDVTTSQRIPVHLITRFSGALFDTKREFDIEFPNLSPSLASELEFKLQNNKTQQFISLLVLKSFFFTGNGGVNSNAVIYGTGADVISNAFDNLLNKGYNNFSLKPTYKVGEKNNVEGIDVNDQLGLELDYKINDRIIVNGKFGVPVGDKSGSSVIGEGNIDFLLNDEGTFRLSIFNRQNEIQYTEEEQGYTQGFGLNYKIDFDTGKEFLQKLGILKKKDTVKNLLNDTIRFQKIKKIPNFKGLKKNKIKQDE